MCSRTECWDQGQGLTGISRDTSALIITSSLISTEKSLMMKCLSQFTHTHTHTHTQNIQISYNFHWLLFYSVTFTSFHITKKDKNIYEYNQLRSFQHGVNDGWVMYKKLQFIDLITAGLVYQLMLFCLLPHTTRVILFRILTSGSVPCQKSTHFWLFCIY